MRFLIDIQNRSEIIKGACLIPIGVSGTLPSWVVSKLLHRVEARFILTLSIVAFAVRAALFLTQTEATFYWALTFPCFISTFGPDMSFAAISVFITSSMAKSYQGAAGGLLLTAQNLSSVVMAAVGDSIALSGSKGGRIWL